MFLQNAVIVFSTASTAFTIMDVEFDVCIVDEATQLVEAHTALVLKPNLECLVLAGDHLQLPATVISEVARQNGYGVSLFERLIKTSPSLLLGTQYRMHPEILKFPNKKFYDGQIASASNVTANNYSREWSDKYRPIELIDTCSGKEETNEYNSKFNAFECEVTKFIVEDINKVRDREVNTSLGIITPYQAQVKRLSYLNRESTDTSKFSVKVMSVDGCQGQEFDIVIFSGMNFIESNTYFIILFHVLPPMRLCLFLVYVNFLL